MNKTVYDIDGVILDWYPQALNLLNLKLEKVDSWDCPKITVNWSKIKANPSFWHSIKALQPYQGQKFDAFLTAIPENYKEIRRMNLVEVEWPDKPLFVSDDKANWMIENGYDTIVDDKPSTIRECIHKGLNAIQFYPYYANWEKVDGARIIYDLRELNL